MPLKGTITLLRSDSEEDRKLGLQQLWENTSLQKTALYFYKRYETILQPKTWDDLFVDSVVAFAEAVQKSDKKLVHPPSYFRGICRNLCEAESRRVQRQDTAVDTLQMILENDPKTVLRTRIEAVLEALSQQCKLMLWQFFLAEPPVTDPDKLTIIMQDAGFHMNPNSLSSSLSRCKKRFRDLLGGDPSSLFED